MKIKVRLIDANDLKNLSCADQQTYKEAKRQIRKPILSAIDIYKINALYKNENLEEDREQTLSYMQKVLDLEESALCNVPERIKYYM